MIREYHFDMYEQIIRLHRLNLSSVGQQTNNTDFMKKLQRQVLRFKKNDSFKDQFIEESYKKVMF